MNTQTDFAKTYESMSDGQLLQTASEGCLVDEAKQTLAEELHRRNLKIDELPRHKESLRTRLRREAYSSDPVPEHGRAERTRMRSFTYRCGRQCFPVCKRI